MATIKEHDFVKFKEDWWKRKYAKISFTTDNIFEVESITSNGYKLDMFNEQVPMGYMEPVPIDGKSDYNVIYDPLIAASFIDPNETPPEHTVDHRYYLEAFKGSYYTEGKTLYDIVKSRKYKYVHEVQQWLRRDFTWEELKIDYHFKKLPEVYAMKLWGYKDDFVNNGVPAHLFIYELCNILYIKYVSDNNSNLEIPYTWEKLKSASDQLKYYDADVLKLKNHAYLTSNGVLKEVINYIGLIDSSLFSEILELLISYEMQKPSNILNQYCSSYKILETAVKVLKPKDGESWDDPAAGTCGTMVAIDKYCKQHGGHVSLSGCEIYPPAEWIGRCNLLFHNIECNLEKKDVFDRDQKQFDGVICDIPLGGVRMEAKDKYQVNSTSRLLNFIQEICVSLKSNASSRAAFMVPDSFFFQSKSDAIDVKSYLFGDFNVSVILRLPVELVGTKICVSLMFFDREHNNSDVWIYDARSIVSNRYNEPQPDKFLDKFVSLQLHYQELPSIQRKEKEWRRITKQDIAAKGYCFDIDELYKPSNNLKGSITSLKEAIKLSKDVTKDLQSLYQKIQDDEQ